VGPALRDGNRRQAPFYEEGVPRWVRQHDDGGSCGL